MLTPEEKLLAEHLGLPLDITSQELEKARKATARQQKMTKFEAERKIRYRLHKKVKRFVYLKPAARLMRVEDITLSDVPAKVKVAIYELVSAYGYTLTPIVTGAFN